VDYLLKRTNLEGKVAVVTGGAGGLGWPISRDLALAGMHVAVCDRDPDAVAEAARRIGEISPSSLVEQADVREPEQMEAFFAAVDERFGRLDVLVDVPGGGFVAPLLDTRRKGWEAIIRQNFTYVLDTTQHAARRMRAQGQGGSIIYVTSVEAHRGVPDRAVYGAMKAAVTSLAWTLSLELGSSAIRVNTVAPDLFTRAALEGYEGPRPLEGAEALDDRISIPMGREGTGEDLSGAVLFLASDLSAYVTGSTVHVDGGTLASSGWFGWPEPGDAGEAKTAWDNRIPRRVLEGLEG